MFEILQSSIALSTIFVILVPDSTKTNMIRKIQIIISILFLLQLLLPLKSSAAEKFQLPDDPEQNAIALFETGKFEEALPVFEDLVRLYPDDKKLNYYLGACLLEAKSYGIRARQALLASVNKDNPDKLNYYLGIAFQAENEFLTALDYYSRFEKEAKGKTKKSVDFERLIGLCEQGVNPFVSEKKENEPVVNQLLDTIVEPLVEIVPVLTVDTVDTVPIVVIPNVLEDSILSFQVNPEIKYLKISQFKNKEAQKTFIGSWYKRKELDSLLFYTDRLRKEYAKLDVEQRPVLGNQILENEQKILQLNRDIPAAELIAHNLEVDFWSKATVDDKEELLKQNQEISDSVQNLVAKKQKVINNLPPESVEIPVIRKTEPKVEDSPEKGIVYKIQIGAFSKEPPDWIKRLYKKLSLIRKISNYIDENGVTVYTTGELRSYADAVEMQKQVKIEGVSDAIVAAYKDGKRIKVSEARKINAE